MLDSSLITTLVGLVLAIVGVASMMLLFTVARELRRIRALQEALLESLRYNSRETSAALNHLAATIARAVRNERDFSSTGDNRGGRP